MGQAFETAVDPPADVWQLIFSQLAGQYTSICSAGLTCRAWRTLSIPSLFEIVDLSSHNNGRLPEREFPDVLPVVYSDYSACFRPRNLVTRQRAFLRLLSERPELAKYVKSLTWKLIWRDFEEKAITETDRHTWAAFSAMKNVTRLDLASLHEISDEAYIRQSPTELFPSVVSLRLAGWMHRGLVKAIISCLDARKLRNLDLDCLQDEGALPDGNPISVDMALEHAHAARRTQISDVVGKDLFQRQESGEAFIFPGPMWLPLRLLSTGPLGSLTKLRVKLAPFNMDIDLRAYDTLFVESTKLILKSRESLRSLSVIFAENRDMYDDTRLRSQYSSSIRSFRTTYRLLAIKMAAKFLSLLLAVLTEHTFEQLANITCEGFQCLEHVKPEEAAAMQLEHSLRSIRNSPLQGVTLTKGSHVDYREVFLGFECEVPDLDGRLQDVLERS